MREIGFDADKYIEEQSKYILERIKAGNGKRLYLEFGGKLVHDKHAMRVLPGFDENAKVKLLQRMKDQAEIIICVYSGDIINSKTRQDFGITYDLEVLRLIDIFRKHDLKINSVVVTRYEDAPAVNRFINKLERRDIKTYKHCFTKGYPRRRLRGQSLYRGNEAVDCRNRTGRRQRQAGDQPFAALSRI